MTHIITKTLAFMATITLVMSLATACGNTQKKADRESIAQAKADSLAIVAKAEKEKAVQDLISILPEEPIFDIKTNYGTIKVKLYSKTPLHRANFEKLALSGYYDGLKFHRVIRGFMIQGGDPNSKDDTKIQEWGQGGPGYTIPAEIVEGLTHKKGALAAARRGDTANPQRESSGSQFYLVQDEKACASLDGSYTVFGETVEGLDVIDKIAKVPTSTNQGKKDVPVDPVTIISITLDEASKPAAQEPAPAE